MMHIYPIPHLIIALSINKFFITDKYKIFTKSLRFLSIFCVLLIAWSNIRVDAKYIKAFNRDNTRAIWSTSIYDLASYIKENPDKEFISVDWGMHTQLLTLTNGKAKLSEQVWLFKDLNLKSEEEKMKVLRENMGKKGQVIFICHPDNETIFQVAKNNLLDLLRQNGVGYELVKTFVKRNRVCFELYAIK
jgi:hypothetical protein